MINDASGKFKVSHCHPQKDWFPLSLVLYYQFTRPANYLSNWNDLIHCPKWQRSHCVPLIIFEPRFPIYIFKYLVIQTFLQMFEPLIPLHILLRQRVVLNQSNFFMFHPPFPLGSDKCSHVTKWSELPLPVPFQRKLKILEHIVWTIELGTIIRENQYTGTLVRTTWTKVNLPLSDKER